MKKKVSKLTLGKEVLKSLTDTAIDKMAAGNVPPVSIWTGFCDTADTVC